ncbi:dihydropteroate synthase [Beijerinckia mobilis]|uniref:dihydropteroate synthase n=1 Tax=Beijerinckia mobilis TaxID=231434 RepID=UPI0005589E21|nr:dihydropteroate synthase [Beijerinckia mobilis]
MTNESTHRADHTARCDRLFALCRERPVIMGILNLTPDSFSDGGRFDSADAAIEHARLLATEGADIVDIGAESTRPGFTPIPAEEEIRRLAPLAAICAAVERPVSIDTMKAATARYALAQGASIVNDIWGLRRDPAMAGVVAEAGAGLIIMHNREAVDPGIDILGDLRRAFDDSLERAAKAGIPASRIMLDPGIGFGKTAAQNLLVLRRLDGIADYGLPILVGLSRKSFIGALLGADVAHRDIGTLAANLAAAARGAAVFRVHNVEIHAAAFKILAAIDHA